MSNSFEKYGDILFDAFRDNLKAHEIVAKKKEILDEIIEHYDRPISEILFVGFNPGILGYSDLPIYIAEVGAEAQQYLSESKINFKVVDLTKPKPNKFSVIVAFDEYFTFASSDQEQKDKVDRLCGLCDSFIVTTLKDYKNQDFKDKEFSQPILVKNVDSKRIYFEHYELSSLDRNASLGTNYVIADDDVSIVGPFARRNMFFKQLAKFSLDAGAKNFLVHKNLMYKSIIKKNYEHIITIKF
jgi:hypothetical protein